MNKKILTIICCIVLLVSVFSLSVSAFWEAGDSSTPRYYSPLNFDFQVFGMTAELMPTISYDANSGYPSIVEENADGYLSRDNFGFSSLLSGAMEVSYRLKLSTQESADNFTMKIVGNQGIYDFAKYGIPNITVPAGYTANVSYELHYRFTQSQSYTTDTGKGYILERSYANNHKIPLLFDTVTSNGEEYLIVGDVIVDVYDVIIEFIKDDDESMWGNPGFYQWNSVLSIYTEELDEFFALYGEEITLLSSDSDCFYLTSLSNGVVDGFPCDGIIFVQNLDDAYEVRYQDYTNGEQLLVYSFESSSWYSLEGNGDNDVGYMGDTLTEIEVRTLYFSQHPYNMFDVCYSFAEVAYTSDDCRLAFLRYFGENTTYYETNPLQTVVNTDGVTYSFTDGDGGLYVNYTVDRSVKGEYVSALNSYFNLGKSMGGGDGIIDVNFSTWIAKAVGGFFDFELFPGFTFGGIFAVIISILLAVVFLKLFAGG